VGAAQALPIPRLTPFGLRPTCAALPRVTRPASPRGGVAQPVRAAES
jgi:hypothetical protein